MKLNFEETYAIQNVKYILKAVIFSPDDKFLTLKRSHHDRSRPNAWDLPGGNLEVQQILDYASASGKGDENDILIKALRDEIQQETSLEIDKQTFQSLHNGSGFNPDKQSFVIVLGYSCRTPDSSRLRISNEHSDAKWVTREEFLRLEVGDDGGIHKAIVERLPVNEQ